MFWIRTERGTVLSTTEPTEGVFLKPMMVRAHSEISVVTLVDQRGVGATLPPPDAEAYPAPLLKSNLQKAVRRKRCIEALATAAYLVRQYPIELLRRLPIIMVEDALIHTRYLPEVCWLMVAASRKYALTVADERVVLEAVQACLLSHARYDTLLTPMAARAPTDAVSLALFVRALYGGMPGDMRMLEYLRAVYQLGTLPTQSTEIVLDWAHVRAFDQSMVLPEAVDYHCYPTLLNRVPGLTRDVLWWARSGVNVRPLMYAPLRESYTNHRRETARRALEPYREQWDQVVQNVLDSVQPEPRKN